LSVVCAVAAGADFAAWLPKLKKDPLVSKVALVAGLLVLVISCVGEGRGR
jgi:hypothetical protein